MKIIEGFESAKPVLSRQTPKESPDSDDRERVVRQIVNDVRDRGDAALFEYTEKFDGVKLASLEVDKERIDRAYRQVDAGLLSALKLASERITAFHTEQKKKLLQESA